MSAMFELHIEQGPILEHERAMIGVVSGVQGIRWYELAITGREAHAGSTPMDMRHDALVAAAKAIEIVQSVGLGYSPLARSTVGSIEVRPNSRNVIPGEVFLTIDLRHPDDSVLDLMETELQRSIRSKVVLKGLPARLERIWNSPPVRFDNDLMAHVRSAAERLGFKHLDIVSGAGHDAAYVARVAPTTMIFVPCRDGVSHNEEEDATFEQCAAGAAVLLEAVLAFDSTLESRTVAP
jgi:N-carbamoyl-L-amino-acid hydrolase